MRCETRTRSTLPLIPNRAALTLVVVAVLGLSACRSSQPEEIQAELPSVFPGHSIEQIGLYVNGSADTLEAFVAKANVSINSPSQNLRFNTTIDHRKADSLFMNVKVTLGIEAARALVTPDSFFVLDRLKKKLYFGDISKASEVFPFPVGGSHLLETLLGLPTIDVDANWTLSADSAHYMLTSTSPDLNITIDPRLWRVTHYAEKDADGALIEERTYSDFATMDGVVLARRFVMSRPVDNTTVSMFYGNIDLNPDRLTFDLTYSDNTERVPVR